MIYLIDKKTYIKMDNYYAEVNVTNDRVVPVKDRKKIYCSDVPADKVKSYGLEEYKNLKNSPSNKEIN